MARITPVMTSSLRMAIEGSSAGRGRRPEWLERASDFRFLDYTADKDDTLLVLSVPMIGEAAEDLYRQKQLWATRPSPEETAIEVLARVVEQVGGENEESDWFDCALLVKLSTLDSLFSDRLRAFVLPAGHTRTAPRRPSVVDHRVTAAAAGLSRRTPPTRQVRVVGVLDMIRKSTRSFSLKLDDGTEVRGVVENAETVSALKQLFGSRVLVHGSAAYRPSGRLLRIDASAVESGEGQPAIFSRAPQSMRRKTYLVPERRDSRRKRGVAAFFGTWPGDESAADFERMLREIRG